MIPPRQGASGGPPMARWPGSMAGRPTDVLYDSAAPLRYAHDADYPGITPDGER